MDWPDAWIFANGANLSFERIQEVFNKAGMFVATASGKAVG